MSIYLNKALSQIFEVSYDSSLDNIETNNKNIIPHESYHFFTGKNHTEETKQKISESQRGNQFAKDSKRNQQWYDKNIGNWSKEKNGMYGKSHSIEARQKISESKKKQITVNNMLFSSAKEAAIYYKVSQQTMCKWVKKGKAIYNDGHNINHKKE
jgi:hypothetical protein